MEEIIVPKKTKIVAHIMRIVGVLALICLSLAYLEFLPDSLEGLAVFFAYLLIPIYLIFLSSASTSIGIVIAILFYLCFIILSHFILKGKKQAWTPFVVLFSLIWLQVCPLFFLAAIFHGKELPELILGMFVVFILSLPLALLLSDRKFYWQKSSSKVLLITIFFIALSVSVFIVINSMLPSRWTRTAEGRIRSDMSQMRTQAEITRDKDGDYNNVKVSGGDLDIEKLCDDIERLSGTKPTIYNNGEKYCAYVELPMKKKKWPWQKQEHSGYYCIDSALTATQTNQNPGSSGYCDGNTFICPNSKSLKEDAEASETIAEDETADLSSTVLATEDWNTYTNEEYGFEIKYPEDWNTFEHITIGLTKGDAVIDIEQVRDLEGASLEEMFDKKIIMSVKTVIQPKKEIYIGEQKAYSFLGTFCTQICTGSHEDIFAPFVIIYFSHNNKIYEMKYTEWQEIKDWKDYDTFLIMLSTFKFIKSSEKISKDETADWKTYRNEEYGFEMKYPEDWECEDWVLSNHINCGLIGQIVPLYHPVSISIYSAEELPVSRNCQDGIESYIKIFSKEAYKCTQEIVVFTERGAEYDPPIKIKYVTIKIENNNQLYVLSLNAESFSYKFSVFNQMLSTFRFLE